MSARGIARVTLGAALVGAGIAHLTVARREFRAQVPDTVVEAVPMSEDDVVVASGWVEIGLGTALALAPRRVRRRVGDVAAAFFVAVFPGNVSQWLHRRDAFGLDTDRKRAVRLLFQPVLVAWARWATRD